MGALGKWLKSLIGLKKTQSRHQWCGRKWRLWRSDKGGHVAASDSSSFRVDDVFSAAVAIVVRATTKDFMFRGFLFARQALRALKAVVRVQVIFRGRQVRKQAAVTLRRMQALDKLAIALEDEVKENPDSLVQDLMDDEAAKHEPTIEMIRNFCLMDLDSDNCVIIDRDDIHHNNVAYSENSKSVDIVVSQGDPLSSTGDVWPPVSMPDSYYRSTLNHEYASASELSLGHSRVFEQQQVRLMDLESDICEEDTRKDLLHRQSNDGSFFNPYADQEVQGQNEVLQHFYKGQGGFTLSSRAEANTVRFTASIKCFNGDGSVFWTFQRASASIAALRIEAEEIE
ncbi:unnamed protein product [Camellia sinensis]